MLENVSKVNNKQLIEMLVDSMLVDWSPFGGAGSMGLPVCVLGHPGAGKSQAGKAACKALTAATGDDCRFIDLRTLLYDPAEIKGIQALPDDGELFTRLLNPDWMRGLDFDGHYLICLEEFTKAPGAVANACLQVVLDRQVASHKFGPNWRVMLTGNLLSSRAGDHPIGSAMRDRFATVILETDPAGWIDWAQESGVDPVIWSAVKMNPDLVNGWDPETDPLAFPTARGLHMLSQTVIRHSDYDDKLRALRRWAVPILGEEHGNKIVTHATLLADMPDPLDCLNDPSGAPVVDQIGPAFYLANAIAAFVTRDTMRNLTTYARRCQHEVAMAMVEGAVRRDADLKKTAAYIEFISEYDPRQIS